MARPPLPSAAAARAREAAAPPTAPPPSREVLPRAARRSSGLPAAIRRRSCTKRATLLLVARSAGAGGQRRRARARKARVSSLTVVGGRRGAERSEISLCHSTTRRPGLRAAPGAPLAPRARTHGPCEPPHCARRVRNSTHGPVRVAFDFGENQARLLGLLPPDARHLRVGARATARSASRALATLSAARGRRPRFRRLHGRGGGDVLALRRGGGLPSFWGLPSFFALFLPTGVCVSVLCGPVGLVSGGGRSWGRSRKRDKS